MVRAKDRLVIRVSGRLGLLVLLPVALGQSGCAKLKSARQPANQPVEFGTDFPPINDTRPGFSGTAPGVSKDIYAARFGRPKNTSEAGADVVPTDASAPSRPGDVRSSDHPQVALAAPVSTSRPSPESAPTTALARQPDTTPATRESSPPRPDPGGPALTAILAESRTAIDRLTTYQVNMNHQERVDGVLNPPEDVLLSVRRSPKAVRIEWLDGAHKGREVIYVANDAKGLMHVHMGDSALPIPDITMSPDSPLAVRSSRHPINEAGFEIVVDRLEKFLQAQTSHPGGDNTLVYEGLEQPAGVAKPCHKILRVSPEGEHWLVYIDPNTHFPTLVQGTTGTGELIERYIFREPSVDPAELARNEAFDPVARWGEPRGFLQKLARAGSAAADKSKK